MDTQTPPVADPPQPQKIVIEVVQPSKEKEETNVNAERKDNNVEYKYNAEYQRFCDDLGVDKYKRDDYRTAEKLSFIYDWAKNQVGTDDGNAISVAVRDLVRTLGVQNLQGVSLADYLFQWTRLDLSSEKLRMKEKEKGMIEKSMEMKAEIKKIEPRISEQELDARVQAGIKDLRKRIGMKVKSHITASINKSIKEAIQKAVPA